MKLLRHLRIPIFLFFLVLVVISSVQAFIVAGPYTIVSSSSGEPLNHGGHRHNGFGANGRLWFFYTDESSLYYNTSETGATWTTGIQVSNDTYEFGIWYDGIYIHLAYVSTLGTGQVQWMFYRRGIPNSDGSIIWGTPQLVMQVGYVGEQANLLLDPNISSDYDSYPYITYTAYLGAGNTPYANIIKSDHNDGTWHNATDFPYFLTNYASGSSILPFSNNDMYVVYQNGSWIKGVEYASDVWASHENIASSSNNYWLAPSVVIASDEVQLVYEITNSYRHLRRYSNGTWTATTVTSGISEAQANMPTLTKVDDTPRLVLFSTGNDSSQPSGDHHIYYAEYDGSNWGAYTAAYEESTIFSYENAVASFYATYEGLTCFAYETSPANYGVNLLVLYEEPPSNPPPEYTYLPDQFLRGTTTLDYYMRDDTHTINGQYAYILNQTQSPTSHSITTSILSDTLQTATWGFRFYLTYSDNSTQELSVGTPTAIMTRTENGSSLQTSTWLSPYIDWGTGNVALTAIRTDIYVRFGTGTWQLASTYTTSLLPYRGLMNTTWTIYLYTTYTITQPSNYNLTATTNWGSTAYTSGINDITFINALPYELMLDRAKNGDIVGFLLLPYVAILGPIFYGLLLLILFYPIYKRTQSFTVILALLMLLGGAGGAFLSALIPTAGFQWGWILFAFGLAGFMFKIIRSAGG